MSEEQPQQQPPTNWPDAFSYTIGCLTFIVFIWIVCGCPGLRK